MSDVISYSAAISACNHWQAALQLISELEECFSQQIPKASLTLGFLFRMLREVGSKVFRLGAVVEDLGWSLTKWGGAWTELGWSDAGEMRWIDGFAWERPCGDAAGCWGDAEGAQIRGEEGGSAALTTAWRSGCMVRVVRRRRGGGALLF